VLLGYNLYRFAVNISSVTQTQGVDSQPPLTTTAFVYTTETLDREDVASYLFTITARDPTNSPLSASAQLVVSVGDVNDNAPVFPMSSYVISASEGQQNSLVGIFNVRVPLFIKDYCQSTKYIIAVSFLSVLCHTIQI